MNAKSLMSGMVMGAALGVTAGLLLAPSSGEKTRKKLAKGSMKIKKNVQEYIQGSLQELKDQVNERIDQIASRGKETINHVSEKVKI